LKIFKHAQGGRFFVDTVYIMIKLYIVNRYSPTSTYKCIIVINLNNKQWIALLLTIFSH